VQISMGETHACVTTRGGNARCWGDNQYGQLGDGALGTRKEPTWVSWFHPALMPGPGEGLFGCRPAPDVQRACKAMAGDCALEPPPEYWSTGPGGGTLCDDDCMARIDAELKRLAVPACMCTCSEEYKQLQLEAERKRPKNPPPSAAPGAKMRSPKL